LETETEEPIVDFDATDDQKVLLDASSRFIQQAYPLARVRERAYSNIANAADYRRQAGELGWFSMLVPGELGGGNVSGNGVLDAALVAYKRGGMLQPGPFVGTNVVAYALSVAGNEGQREEVLPALMSGQQSASWAVSAPGGPAAMEAGVTAEFKGGSYQLSGSKIFVQDVDESCWLLVTAAINDGISQFLVPPGTPGVTVVALDALDISRRFSEVRFEGAQLPSSALVGVTGEASDLAARQSAIASVLTVAESVGAMDHDFEMTLQYAKDRIAFGRPIGSFQAIKHLLADMSLSLEMSKAISLAAAKSLGADDGYGLEAASMAKAFVGDCGVDLAQNCFQIFGGIGFTWEHDQHLYLRRLTTDAALFGDPVWHRERLCQLSGL
jgi:alkylation response protein AidB-like acyl-CoA dehydrogenase